MANVRVAINGFGRIGRLAFRQMFGAKGYEIVAINDLTSPKMLAHLLKYDSAQGRYEHADTVSADDEAGTITVCGKTIKIYAEKDAANLPWGEIGVDVVLECTGFYTSKAKAQAHIDAGAKKVVISAPAGNDLPTIVFSVNEKTLTKEDTIISAASCTTNCLAPMANALNKAYPIVSGIMTTVHAYTGDQMVLDGPHRKGDLRRARAAAANIVPNSTGAAKAIGLVIPELNKKLIGSAQRVPVPTGSTTILVAVGKGKDVTKESINAAMKAASSASFGYTEEELVSSDIVGITYGSLFDATQTMVTKIDDDTYQVQVVSWYDNENSYTSQMVRGTVIQSLIKTLPSGSVFFTPRKPSSPVLIRPEKAYNRYDEIVFGNRKCARGGGNLPSPRVIYRDRRQGRLFQKRKKTARIFRPRNRALRQGGRNPDRGGGDAPRQIFCGGSRRPRKDRAGGTLRAGRGR